MLDNFEIKLNELSHEKLKKIFRHEALCKDYTANRVNFTAKSTRNPTVRKTKTGFIHR